jgi:hypothetical protein
VNPVPDAHNWNEEHRGECKSPSDGDGAPRVDVRGAVVHGNLKGTVVKQEEHDDYLKRRNQIKVRLRGRLHVYKSVYDYMHEWHASQIGIQFLI